MAALGETKKTETQHFCSQHGCGNTANRRCSACKLVYYCSLACQKGHWTIHQPPCAVKDVEPTAKELQLFIAIATAVIESCGGEWTPELSKRYEEETTRIEKALSTTPCPDRVLDAKAVSGSSLSPFAAALTPLRYVPIAYFVQDLKVGSSRERALLFKAVVDRSTTPLFQSTLQRVFAAGEGQQAKSWNTVFFESRPDVHYTVDLLSAKPRLLLDASRDAKRFRQAMTFNTGVPLFICRIHDAKLIKTLIPAATEPEDGDSRAEKDLKT